MRRSLLWIPVLAGLLLGTSPRAEAAEVELEDGSVISGQITSLKDGVYTIETESLGTLRLDESKVSGIRLRSHGAPAPAEGRPAGAPSLEAMKLRILGDEDAMQGILALGNDPEIRKLLEDPAVMGAVLSGDVNALMANPRFLELLNHPGIRRIQRDLAE